jgi:hypothetical protein
MLTLQWSGLNQSDIARKLGIERQAVSKALAAIPAMFRLSTKPRSPHQPNLPINRTKQSALPGTIKHMFASD